MSLSPIRINDKYAASFQSSKSHHSNPKINTGNNNHYLEKDTFDDGKISAKKSLKHFVKGIISPFTTLLSSPKNLIIGAGAVVGSAALCAAFPPLLPALAALGVVTGSAQLASGGYKALTAKTDKQAEQAWESIGSGVFSVGSSALGAKSSLKAAGVKETKNLNFIKATVKCFKEIPSSFTKSFKMAKNGTGLTNLKNTVFKPVNYVDPEDLAKLEKFGYGTDKLDEIKNYSKMLHQEGKNSVYANPENGKQSCLQELIDVLPDELKDKVNFRVKSESSIKDKLINKLTNEKNPIKIESLDDAKQQIGDLIGTCIALDNPDEANITMLVDSLSDGLRTGKITFLELDNYRGKDTIPYFTADHIDSLREAAKTYNVDINSYEGFGFREITNQKIKPSGYTTAQINVKYKDGSLGEFQIRGKGVQKLANVEHIPYDLRQSKDLAGGNHLLQKLYKPLEKYVKLLSNDGYTEYNNYLDELYKYHRNKELGIITKQKPIIADYIKSGPSKVIQNSTENPLSNSELQEIYLKVIKMLDIDNIENLHTDASWLKAIPKTSRQKVLTQSLTTYLSTNPNIQERKINN